MNKQTVEGKVDQAAGKIKQKVGEATGKQRLANEGVAEQMKGAAKETWGRTKDAAKDAARAGSSQAGGKQESLKNRADVRAHDVREKITSAMQTAKEKISGKLDEVKRDHRR